MSLTLRRRPKGLDKQLWAAKAVSDSAVNLFQQAATRLESVAEQSAGIANAAADEAEAVTTAAAEEASGLRDDAEAEAVRLTEEASVEAARLSKISEDAGFEATIASRRANSIRRIFLDI